MKHLSPNHISHRFSAEDPPAIRVSKDEVFSATTTDRFKDVTEYPFTGMSRDITNSINGPIYIEGTQVGDTLKIEIITIKPSGKLGYVMVLPGQGALGDEIHAFTKESVYLKGSNALFANGTCLPIKPMLGIVGVAPPNGEARLKSSGTCGRIMSITDVTAGSSIYLPVFHDGAFLSIGDSHIAMGDGESTSSAIEGSLDVTLRVSTANDFCKKTPLVMTKDKVITFGRADTMEHASRMAIFAMADLLMATLDISYQDSAMLIGSGSDLRAGLALHSPYIMKLMMPRSVLNL